VNGAATATSPLDASTLAAFVRPGPRYTSYPPATVFHGEFDAQVASAELQRLARERPNASISLYCHIPFCSQLCWYCGCNVVVTRRRERAGSYVDLLVREIELITDLCGTGRPLTEIALGGGSPNFLRPHDLTVLMRALDQRFSPGDNAVFGIELDPRDTSHEFVATLAEFGFRRLSVGVQDFSEEVQRRINRHQTREQTRALVDDARQHGFESVNMDLIYGLPGQTPTSFADTLESVLDMEPEQVSLFGYAHLPNRLPHQKLVERDGPVPDLQERAALLDVALVAFAGQGYRRIGLDHFARVDAPLARAADEGRLQRNFQGYVVDSADVLLACGATGITDTGHAYWQNHKLKEWQTAIEAGELPVARGAHLSDDDLIRRHVITRLMCDAALDFGAVDAHFGIRCEDYFAAELEQLETGEEVALARVDRQARRIIATELGSYLIRNVCMVFDAHLARSQARFSPTL
jgi:oxygen-independent coproporphyrinogen-3 oxidase